MAKYKVLKTNKLTQPPFKVGDIVEGVPATTGDTINVMGFLNGKRITFGFRNSELSLLGKKTETGTKTPLLDTKTPIIDTKTPVVDDQTPAVDTKSVNEDFVKKVKMYGNIITISSIAGLSLGLLFAYKRKSSVGGYIGWGLLGSALVGGVAFAIYGKKMIQATLGNVATNLNQAILDKPLDVMVALKMAEDGSGKVLDNDAKAKFISLYGSLSDKEKIAYAEVISIQVSCLKSNPTDGMKQFSCFVLSEPALISKYGEDTMKSLNAKVIAMQKSK